LVEFAAGIPPHFQTRGLAGKSILKSAVRDLLPKGIIYRRKMGFPTPWRTWLAGTQLDLIEGFLLEPRSLGRGIFKKDALRRLFAEHRARFRDHRDRIWRLLNLEIWHRVFLDVESTDQVAGRLSHPSAPPAPSSD
jgi:asparagine synthase (glutamine-hydrolysing)